MHSSLLLPPFPLFLQRFIPFPFGRPNTLGQLLFWTGVVPGDVSTWPGSLTQFSSFMMMLIEGEGAPAQTTERMLNISNWACNSSQVPNPIASCSPLLSHPRPATVASLLRRFCCVCGSPLSLFYQHHEEGVQQPNQVETSPGTPPVQEKEWSGDVGTANRKWNGTQGEQKK